MAYIKHRLRRKNESGGYDIMHIETCTDMVLRFGDDGTSSETLESTLKKIENQIKNVGGIENPIADNLVIMDGAGKLMAAGKTVTDFASATHNHSFDNVTGGTGSRVAVTNSSGVLTTSGISTTKLGYLTDVTSNIQAQLNGKATSDHNHDGVYIKSTLIGAASGIAPLGTDSKVPAAYLPSYVDDVIENTYANFPTTGETGKIYVDTGTNKTYRWSGSAYVEISASLALGETSATAYRGDRGKIAYDHSQATHARTDATLTAKSNTNGNLKINGSEVTVYTHPAYTAKSSGFYKVTVDALGHVSAVTAVTKADITNLGIPGAATTLTDLGITATAAELNYVDGVTSNIQTQLNGKAASSHGTHVSFSTTAPVVAGTAAVGTASTVSRSDHVHPAQTTVSGNAGSATKWATARNINGLSVNGEANRVNYGTCSTAAATVEKTVACTGFALITGSEITVKFTVTNTASNPTLNVNSTGAKAIYYRGAAISAGYLAANRTYTFRYNGTQYELVGDVNTNTTYSNMTAATASAAGKAGLVPAPAAGAQGKFLRGDGTWQTPTNTTYSNMTAATADAAGKAGLVPAPAAGKQTSFLRGDGTWVIPTNTDTKNTAGSTNSSSKLFLIGATSQAANPQTYSHDTVYVGTNGHLYSNGVKVLDIRFASSQPTNQTTDDLWFQPLS